MCLAFLISSVSLCWSLSHEKGIGKDNIRNMLRLQGITRASQWHCKDNKRTKWTSEDKPRTSRGQRKDLQRAAPTESTTLPKIQNYIISVFMKLTAEKSDWAMPPWPSLWIHQYVCTCTWTCDSPSPYPYPRICTSNCTSNLHMVMYVWLIYFTGLYSMGSSCMYLRYFCPFLLIIQLIQISIMELLTAHPY